MRENQDKRKGKIIVIQTCEKRRRKKKIRTREEDKKKRERRQVRNNKCKEDLIKRAHVVRQVPFKEISVSVILTYVYCIACVYQVVM